MTTPTTPGLWMQRRTWLAFTPFLVVSLAHLGFIVAGNTALVALSKPALMPALLIALLVAAPRVRTLVVLLTAAGIVFSWLGDVLLQSPAEIGFLIGLGAFLVAHLFYIAVFVKLGQGRLRPWVLIYVLWFAGLVFVLAPYLGALIIPVVVYGLVLGADAVLATRVNVLAGLGAALFLTSDSLLAIDRFAPFEVLGGGVDFSIMLTYLAGEGLIVAGILAALHAHALSQPQNT